MEKSRVCSCLKGIGIQLSPQDNGRIVEWWENGGNVGKSGGKNISNLEFSTQINYQTCMIYSDLKDLQIFLPSTFSQEVSKSVKRKESNSRKTQKEFPSYW